MGILDSFKKKKKEAKELKNEELQEPRETWEQSAETDYITRPGGMFGVLLLMKERCETPSDEKMMEVLSKHLGEIEMAGGDGVASFAAKEYLSQLEDGNFPVMLSIFDCDEFDAETITPFQRSQIWKEHRDRILSECKWKILANDMMGGGLPPKVRANMLMDYLEALVELYPQCEAVYVCNSGKLIPADWIRAKEVTGLARFVKYAVNVRFFNVKGSGEMLVDTIGLSLLFVEDIQYHFCHMNPDFLVSHAYHMALYVLENDCPIKNGDTIDGIRDGEFVQDIQWKCWYENSLIGPNRVVIDIHMGEYAAGVREEKEHETV